ncbi:hypothetical protein J1N35_016065 [Gossypium stocksii]|uniref:Coiled-coil domain-containing protein n=1 Tax=Gossypium stocksii TaxID=47602 RepID=A0A9D3VZN0_9ROSI|nr:hypothetical protein J1N35_016065 [Gossypium stocksii]
MPKKMSVYSKAEAARARKCATEADRKELEAREKEEQYFSPKQKRSSTGAKPRVRNPKPRLAVLSLVRSISCISWYYQCTSAFEGAELPKLKEEKPGLTHTQYKDMIWKLWKKSPGNPLNQQSL